MQNTFCHQKKYLKLTFFHPDTSAPCKNTSFSIRLPIRKKIPCRSRQAVTGEITTNVRMPDGIIKL